MILSFTSIATREYKAVLNVRGKAVTAVVRGNNEDDARESLRFEIRSLLTGNGVSSSDVVNGAR